jgi:serine/threonine protein kinase HipA of HipAB toxin-antitoxin module
MKAKNARRWLSRNKAKNIKRAVSGLKPSGFERTCKKVLRNDAKINPDSKRLFNQLYINKDYNQ